MEIWITFWTVYYVLMLGRITCLILIFCLVLKIRQRLSSIVFWCDFSHLLLDPYRRKTFSKYNIAKYCCAILKREKIFLKDLNFLLSKFEMLSLAFLLPVKYKDVTIDVIKILINYKINEILYYILILTWLWKTF